MMFDFGINAGKRKAIKLLQRVCKTKEDGFWGKNSEIAFVKSQLQDFEKCHLFLAYQIMHYEVICNRNPKNRKFYKGWINRVKETIEFIELMS